MNNILHRMKKTAAEHSDPYMIWYPSIAAESTYRELYRLRSSMAPQILRTCIAGGYPSLFQSILAKAHPDHAAVSNANASGATFANAFRTRLSELSAEAKLVVWHEPWKKRTVRQIQGVENKLYKGERRAIHASWDGLYEGFECNAEGVEVLASLPEEWRKEFTDEEQRKRNNENPWVQLDYKEWPPGR